RLPLGTKKQIGPDAKGRAQAIEEPPLRPYGARPPATEGAPAAPGERGGLRECQPSLDDCSLQSRWKPYRRDVHWSCHSISPLDPRPLQGCRSARAYQPEIPVSPTRVYLRASSLEGRFQDLRSFTELQSMYSISSLHLSQPLEEFTHRCRR